MDINENPPTPRNLIGAIEEVEGPICVRRLAEIRERSIWTIYRDVQKGALPYYRDGGQIMFDPSTLGMHYRKKYPSMAAALRMNRNN